MAPSAGRIGAGGGGGGPLCCRVMKKSALLFAIIPFGQGRSVESTAPTSAQVGAGLFASRIRFPMGTEELQRCISAKRHGYPVVTY